MDKTLLKHIAELSRISLSDEELDTFTPQMSTILDSAKVLQSVNTDNVQPMKKHIPFSDLREDISKESLKKEEVLKNAIFSQDGCIKVYGKIFGGIEES